MGRVATGRFLQPGLGGRRLITMGCTGGVILMPLRGAAVFVDQATENVNSLHR